MNSPLASYMADPTHKERAKRDGWQRQEILVVSLDDPRLGPIERQWVKQIGELLYGRTVRDQR